MRLFLILGVLLILISTATAYSQQNPPGIDILLTATGANIIVKNEGTAKQEYVINWNLHNKRIVDTGTVSKMLFPGEVYTIPITFKDINIMEVEAIVQYGPYASRANKIIKAEPFDKRILLGIPLVLLILWYYLMGKRR